MTYREPSNTIKQGGGPHNGRTGAPAGNKNARKHGHHARKLKLTDVRLVDISQQNGPGRLVAAKAEAIFADRGGRANLTELQQDLVGRYVITELLIQSIDCYLLSLPGVVNKRRKAAIPILAERSRLAETSLKIAQAIGLERRDPPAPSLAEFLAQRKAQSEETTEHRPNDAAASPAQPDAREPLSEPQPRDDANGRFLPAENSEKPEAAHGD